MITNTQSNNKKSHKVFRPGNLKTNFPDIVTKSEVWSKFSKTL